MCVLHSDEWCSRARQTYDALPTHELVLPISSPALLEPLRYPRIAQNEAESLSTNRMSVHQSHPEGYR